VHGVILFLLFLPAVDSGGGFLFPNVNLRTREHLKVAIGLTRRGQGWGIESERCRRMESLSHERAGQGANLTHFAAISLSASSLMKTPPTTDLA
jgi:hypothetical protein